MRVATADKTDDTHNSQCCSALGCVMRVLNDVINDVILAKSLKFTLTRKSRRVKLLKHEVLRRRDVMINVLQYKVLKKLGSYTPH